MLRHRLLLLTGAAAMFAAPLLLQAQAPAAGGQAPAAGGVQVGVPEGGRQGRQGGGGGGGQAGGRGGGRQAGPAIPAPRLPDGRVMIGNAPSDKGGLWIATVGITTPLAPNAVGKPGVDAGLIPFQPWAKALFDDRQKHELEPHTRCKASGVSRQFMTPYGVEFVEMPELQRIYIFDVGGPHTYRTIYMDGRTHPKGELPLYYGHSIGWWEGDTLVVDSTNFNESFWLDRRGVPHTEQLHTIERFTRNAAGTIRYEVTIDDPGAYTKPWTAGFDMRRENGQELFEYICQQANYAHELMVGTEESVDRATTIIP